MKWLKAAPTALKGIGSVWRWHLQALDYGLLLPLMSRLPTGIAYRLADWRGEWNAQHGRDWAELSQGLAYIASRTADALRLARPEATEAHVQSWVAQRYRTVAREELEARWLARGDLGRFSMDLPNLKDWATQCKGDGVVVVQPHFHNPLLACVGLAKATGARVWVTISDITDHEQVHPLVSAHFRLKYASAQQWLNGGGFLPTEDKSSLRRFYKALKAGDIVVVLGDLPGQPGGDGVDVPWMGARRLLAAGAVRLAQHTGSCLVGMGVARADGGVWRWQLSKPVSLDVPDAAGEVFACLEAQICADPGGWWASHLLSECQLVGPGQKEH